MKRGTEVAVCQDGKWSRKVKGVVVQTKNGYKIKVRFTYGYDEETTETVEVWFKMQGVIRYEKKPYGTKYGCIYRLKRYKYFAGWVNTDKWWSPWFSVYKWEEKTNA